MPLQSPYPNVYPPPPSYKSSHSSIMSSENSGSNGVVSEVRAELGRIKSDVWGSDLRGVCSAYQTDPKQAESVVSSVIRYLEAIGEPGSIRVVTTKIPDGGPDGSVIFTFVMDGERFKQGTKLDYPPGPPSPVDRDDSEMDKTISVTTQPATTNSPSPDISPRQYWQPQVPYPVSLQTLEFQGTPQHGRHFPFPPAPGGFGWEEPSAQEHLPPPLGFARHCGGTGRWVWVPDDGYGSDSENEYYN